MWVLTMTRRLNMRIRFFAFGLLGCLVVSGLAAWVTGLSFWVLLVISVVAVLVNGIVAAVREDA